MSDSRVNDRFPEILDYYNAIANPKYRNVDLKDFMDKYEQLQALEIDQDMKEAYDKLINAMSQIISRLKKREELRNMPEGKIWSNLSERGMNKVIPAVRKRNGNHPVSMEWTDKWGNTCNLSNGEWTAKNYRVMDAIGYMFLMQQGGDCLPENTIPIFDDLFEVQQRELTLNNQPTKHTFAARIHSMSFTDRDFRKFTDLRMSSAEILNLLLDTSRVEFKLAFPLRLKSTGDKEVTHMMNFHSRFFELSYQDIKERSDGIVQCRSYTVTFNTLLGQFFVNNLLAKYNDRIDLKFYQLPDSAQVLYRRLLIHHNFKKTPVNLRKIAELVDFKDRNQANLINTVERNILEPLKELGYIETYEREQGLDDVRYQILRKTDDSN